MGTLNTTSKQFIVTASANADFQAIVTLWHNFFGTTCGFTQAADSGQINPATVAFPGSNNTDAGQEVWYFNDSLHSTYPVAIRVVYGRGSDANNWRVTISVSLSVTNGSLTFLGTESGTVTINFATAGTRTNADTTAYRVVGSGASGRAVIAWFPDTVSTPRGTIFAIERTKNSDGTDNGDGVVIPYFASMATTNPNGLTFDRLGVYTPAWRTGSGGTANNMMNMLLSSTSLVTPRSIADTGSTLASGKVYAFPFFPTRPGWKYPLMSFLNYFTADFPVDFSTVTIPFYGSNHTYLPLSPSGVLNVGGSNWPLLIRYE